MDIRNVERLVRLAARHNVTRLEVSDGGERVLVELGGVQIQPVLQTVPGAVQSLPVQPAPAQAEAAPAPARDEGLYIQTTPVVGTVYLAQRPGEKPMVSPGDRVSEGQTLCVIEAMKMFSDVTCGCAGTVRRVCVEDGQAVGVGDALFEIERD